MHLDFNEFCCHYASYMWSHLPYLMHVTACPPELFHTPSYTPPLCYITFLQCYPTEIYIFTILISLATLILPPFLVYIALDTFIAKLDAPDTCKWSMLTVDLRRKICPHCHHQLHPHLNIHLPSTLITMTFHPALNLYLLLCHYLHLHIMTWIPPTLIWITYNQCPILISNHKCTNSHHLEGSVHSWTSTHHSNISLQVEWWVILLKHLKYKLTLLLLLQEQYVEMESCEMYSDEQLNIPTRNCIRSLCSSYLCKQYHADWWIGNPQQHCLLMAD